MKIEDLFSSDIIKLFDDDLLFNQEIHNPRSIRFLLRDVYNAYLYMSSNNIIFDGSIMRKIIIMYTIYNNLFKNEEIPSKIGNSDLEKEKISERISNMMTIDDIDSFDKYYKTIKSVVEECECFSLDKQYKCFDGSDDIYELNGVCIITPSQTIARYNDKFCDGSYAGYHDDNFKDILNSVYGCDFKYNYSGQDIKIRFVNTSYKGNQCRGMTIEVPIPINSSQLVALTNLNEAIKKLKNSGIVINIELSMIDKEGLEYFNNKFSDLDKILPNLIIDDYVEYQCREKFFAGQNNYLSNFINKKEIEFKH